MSELAITVFDLRVRKEKKKDLLLAVMRLLASATSEISFEGYFQGTPLFQLGNISTSENGVVKTNTTLPKLDRLTFPLTADRLPAIENAISSISLRGGKGIIHTRIEKDGQLAFAAYDQFHEETVVAFPAISRSSLDQLVRSGVLRSYSDRQMQEKE